MSQIKLLRSEISDNNRRADEKFTEFQTQLWSELQNFANILAQAATEQVIDALQQVIQDFNNNLTEQFGDNFAQLNEAVGRLLEWQENYKGQLSDMKDQYDLAVLAITETEASVARIGEAAQSIPASMEQLQEVMNGLQEIVAANQHQIGELGRHLEAFADIKDRAVEAIPAIREQIDQAIAGATAANETLAAGMQTSANQFTESVQQGSQELAASHQTASNTLIEQSRQTSKACATAIDTMRENLERTITEQATAYRQQADQVFAGLQETIQQALTNTGGAVKKQVDMIDKTAEQEIKKVMESMGSALASISGQFTEDYRRLVAEMQAIVNNQQP